ncbi:MAG: tetratricopeptide repeat protein [Bernardetiaceae bacterium]
MIHKHLLDKRQHAELLQENRSDPLTGETLKAGDEVVFCAGCSSAFLLGSWHYIGGRHCGQSATLSRPPAQFKQIAIKRVHRRSVPDRSPAHGRPRYLIAASLMALMILSLAIYGGYHGYRYLQYRTFKKPSLYSVSSDFAFEKRLMQRGDYYLALGDYPAAMQAYERILDYNPAYQPAQQRRISIREAFQRAYTQGNDYLNRADYGLARQSFKEALRYFPDHDPTHEQLTRIALQESERPRWQVYPAERTLSLSEAVYHLDRPFPGQVQLIEHTPFLQADSRFVVSSPTCRVEASLHQIFVYSAQAMNPRQLMIQDSITAISGGNTWPSVRPRIRYGSSIWEN